MDKQVRDLQKQLFEKDLLIQNLKTQLQHLQDFKNQVSVAFQKLPQEDGPSSVQSCHQPVEEKTNQPAIECGICLLEVPGRFQTQHPNKLTLVPNR